MRSIYAAFFVFASMLAPLVAGGVDPPTQGDLEKLQGRWKLTKYEQNDAAGELLHLLYGVGADKSSEQFHLGVKADLFDFNTKDKVLRVATAKLDETKNPKAIDLVRNTGAGKRTFAGIYKLEDDELTLCIAGSDSRPTAFKANPGQVLLRYKRIKQ